MIEALSIPAERVSQDGRMRVLLIPNEEHDPPFEVAAYRDGERTDQAGTGWYQDAEYARGVAAEMMRRYEERQGNKPTPEILVVESVATVREGLRSILHWSGYAVRVADSCGSALSALERSWPDLLLVNARLQDGSGHDLIVEAKRRRPRMAVVLRAVEPDERDAYLALRAGVNLIIHPASEPGVMHDAIAAALSGTVLIVPARKGARNRLEETLADLRSRSPAVMDHDGRFWESEEKREISRYIPLSERELGVVSLIGRGYGNDAIARTLGISPQTVKNHVTRIIRVLGVSDRASAAVYCVERQWIRNLTWEAPEQEQPALGKEAS